MTTWILDSWPAPSIALSNGNWVGGLPTIPVVMGGTEHTDVPVKLEDAADALLYLRPRDILVRVSAPRKEVDGTRYGKELLRRMAILGFYPFIPESKESTQFSPQFARPKSGNGPPPRFLAPSKDIDTPLPPRPTSQ